MYTIAEKAEIIKSIVSQKLPNKFFDLCIRKNAIGGDECICLDIARSNYQINGISRQYPEHISLRIDGDGIEFFPFGGNGGRRIYRKIDPTIERERFFALGGEDMPAIRIRDFSRAIAKVCDDYKAITEDIEARGLASVY